jgi:hypothetical protein
MRKRLLAAFVVVALSALVPGPATAKGSPSAGIPGISILVRVLQAKPEPRAAVPVSQARPVERQAPVKAALPKPVVSNDVVEVPDAISPAADLVRVRTVMYEEGPGASDGPRSGPCAAATTCKSYVLRPARWPAADKTGGIVIPYAVNESQRRSAREPAGALVPAVQRATAQWTHWDSNIVFKYTGTTTATFGATGKDGGCDDGVNSVSWTPLEQGVIGEAGLCFDRKNRLIRDADLALNSVMHWEVVSGSSPRSRHSYDIQSILTHELGHWFSLLDLYSSNDARQTMYGEAKYGDVRKRTPALGDIIGIQTAYRCGAGDSCPRSGIKND